MGPDYDERPLSIGIVVEACALGLTGILVSLGFFVFNIRLRSNRLIKMSSPILNLFIACGGLLLSTCCALYGLDYFLLDFSASASAVCQTRVGLLACGSTLLFGPMFLKAWRVYRLFKNVGKRRVIIKDSRLLLMTSGLLLVDIVLVVIWQTTDPLVYRPVLLYRQTIPVGNDAANRTETQLTRVHTCTSPSSPSWLAVFILLKMALLCYGLFLSWQTRAVALPAMNDSRCIVVSSVTAMLLATLAVSVSHLWQQRPNAVYACLVMSVWLCTMVALCMAFVPKVALWRRNPEAKGMRVSVASMCSTGPVDPLEQLQEELLQAEAENEILRKSLEEKDASVRKLQQHLTSAHKRLSHLGLSLDLIQDSGLDADFSSSLSDPEDVGGRDGDSHPPAPPYPPGSGATRSGCSRGERLLQGGGNYQTQPSRGRKSASSETESGGLRSSQLGSCDWKQIAEGSRQGSCSTESAPGSRCSPLSSSSGYSARGESSAAVTASMLSSAAPPTPAAAAATTTAVGAALDHSRLGRMSSRDGNRDYHDDDDTDSEKTSSSRGGLTSLAEHYPHFPNSQEESGVGFREGLPFHVPGFSSSSRRLSAPSDNGRASSNHSSSDRSRRKRRRRHQHHQHQHQHRRRHSASSVTNVDKLAEIRAAIAHDLQHARSLSNVLGNSVSKELDNVFRRHRHRQLRRRSSSTRSREDLAGSIVGSYGLEDTSDTFSFVSSFLSVPSLHAVTNDGYALMSSADGLSVLDNDALYPDRRRKTSLTSRAGESADHARSQNPAAAQGADHHHHHQHHQHLHHHHRSSLDSQNTDVRLFRESELNQRLAEHQAPSKTVGERSCHRGTSPATCALVKENCDRNAVNAGSVQKNCRPNRGPGAAPHPGCVQGSGRSLSHLQDGSNGRSQVFTVQTARTPRFVQAGYAQTRALCTTDTFI